MGWEHGESRFFKQRFRWFVLFCNASKDESKLKGFPFLQRVLNECFSNSFSSKGRINFEFVQISNIASIAQSKNNSYQFACFFRNKMSIVGIAHHSIEWCRCPMSRFVRAKKFFDGRKIGWFDGSDAHAKRNYSIVYNSPRKRNGRRDGDGTKSAFHIPQPNAG